MGQDIRNMMKDYTPEGSGLREGHEKRFSDKLQRTFPKKNKKDTYLWLKIAAVVIIFFGIGYFAYQQLNDGMTTDPLLVENKDAEEMQPRQFTLGDLSPDLKKVEEFYINGINLELASLKTNKDHKELIDAYMKRLNELNTEYERLTKELNEVGPTEATITALIDNLKLRLELLFKLKNKLKELKQLENEEIKDITA